VLVADRGMVTRANIDALAAVGVDWITALKAPQVKQLAQTGAIQPSLFDELNLAEITSGDFPGERLIVCRNPLVAAERTRKREELLAATEAELAPIRERVKRGGLVDAGEIGLAVGPAAKRFRMKKHFDLEIADGHFSFARKTGQIAHEAALDGIYVLRTSLAAERLDGTEIVRAYKDLQHVERAFRVLKGPELQIRPIHHRLESRVRAHVFCCMLALYLERHLREVWAELTFQDEQVPGRPDPVAPARRSTEGEHQAHHRGRARPQFPQPARRARRPDAQHDPPARHRRDLRQAHRAHRTASPRARARRGVVTTPTAAVARNPSGQRKTQRADRRNFGLATLELLNRVAQRLSEIERELRELVRIAACHHLVDLAQQQVGVLGRPRLRPAHHTAQRARHEIGDARSAPRAHGLGSLVGARAGALAATPTFSHAPPL